MKRERLVRLFHTIRYLKAKQIYYRLYYLLRNRYRGMRKFSYPLHTEAAGHPLNLQKSIDAPASFERGQFRFLNRAKRFDDEIDWNFPDYGKLWTYNLNYFDFLHQPAMGREEGLGLIEVYIGHMDGVKDGLEPFPISLRGINWIKFLSKHDIRNQTVDASLRAQYAILMDNLEYHLLGNHLLENGFSLLFGAYYFRDESLYAKAKEILTKELHEQVLDDGAHFELSPMYHQIMLFRVLDCINLVKNNEWKARELLGLLSDKASVMLGWLENITFPDGTTPLLNDSAYGIAPEPSQLTEYGASLGIETRNLPLSASGYRVRETDRYKIIVDVGNIGPDYIPGHAHSDTFSFVLYAGGKPLIVDTGTSTYETNERRTAERGTAAHNTVMLDGLEQSEVWGGFRVARRARVYDLTEDEASIKARHDGYRSRLGAIHERKFVFNENSIKITDNIVSGRSHDARFRIHFHPDIEPRIEKNRIVCGDAAVIVTNADITLSHYLYAPEFNTLKKASVLEMSFKKEMEIEIVL